MDLISITANVNMLSMLRQGDTVKLGMNVCPSTSIHLHPAAGMVGRMQRRVDHLPEAPESAGPRPFLLQSFQLLKAEPVSTRIFTSRASLQRLE